MKSRNRGLFSEIGVSSVFNLDAERSDPHVYSTLSAQAVNRVPSGLQQTANLPWVSATDVGFQRRGQRSRPQPHGDAPLPASPTGKPARLRAPRHVYRSLLVGRRKRVGCRPPTAIRAAVPGAQQTSNLKPQTSQGPSGAGAQRAHASHASLAGLPPCGCGAQRLKTSRPHALHDRGNSAPARRAGRSRPARRFGERFPASPGKRFPNAGALPHPSRCEAGTQA